MKTSLLNDELGLDPESRAPAGSPVFYMGFDDWRDAPKASGNRALLGDMLTERPLGPCIGLYPSGWEAEGAPQGFAAWAPATPDFSGCKTPRECQDVVDALCAEAGTDNDPAYASHGPMVVFSPVRLLGPRA